MPASGPHGAGPDVWNLLFEQTPVIVRWALGVLTLGLFTVTGILYRWNRQDIQRIDSRITDNINGVQTRISALEGRLDHRLEEMNRHLIDIAANTKRSFHNE